MNREGCILDNQEYEVLRRYKRPGVVQDHDRETVYDLAGQHLMALGFREGDTAGPPEPQIEETVRLTPLGKRTLSRETALRNPVFSKAYRFIGIVTS